MTTWLQKEPTVTIPQCTAATLICVYIYTLYIYIVVTNKANKNQQEPQLREAAVIISSQVARRISSSSTSTYHVGLSKNLRIWASPNPLVDHRVSYYLAMVFSDTPISYMIWMILSLLYPWGCTLQGASMCFLVPPAGIVKKGSSCGESNGGQAGASTLKLKMMFSIKVNGSEWIWTDLNDLWYDLWLCDTPRCYTLISHDTLLLPVGLSPDIPSFAAPQGPFHPAPWE